MNVFYAEKDAALTKWREIPELENVVKYFSEQ
ncbi:hypothetical protein PC116_g5916 [Phytophthora cactorum]|nr:hypothetical protein PC128_g4805 [Phytophthora cactorum]KAG4246312.1 hypothetical protein PC116_g5916 [Phytophthora cactorum]